MLAVAVHSRLAAKAELIEVVTVHEKVNHPLAARSTSMVFSLHVMLASAEFRDESLGQWSGLKAPKVELSP